jgi:hypothetical protein
MQDEHRPGGFADDEVALPMAGLAAAFNDLRTIIDRRSILDGVARGSGPTRATAFVAPRQITPQGLCLLSGSIDEGVDCLAADGPQPRFIVKFHPDPPRTDVKRLPVRGSLHAACAIDRLQRREAANTLAVFRACLPRCGRKSAGGVRCRPLNGRADTGCAIPRSDVKDASAFTRRSPRRRGR